MLSISERTFMGHSPEVSTPPPVVFGVITDIHFAGRDTEDGKYYRQGLEKLNAFIETCNDRHVDFVICLGDMIDTDNDGNEWTRLAELTGVFDIFHSDWHALVGNHDLETLSKRDFLETIGKKRSWYSFDVGSYHFIILDASFSPDGTDYDHGDFVWTEPYIPVHQLEWLRCNLTASRERDTVIFVHQNLHDNADDRYNIVNSREVRSIIAESGNVRAVIQGHYHKVDTGEYDGIPYVTLVGSINGPRPEGNSFSIVIIDSDTIILEGFGGQENLFFP